MAVMKGTRRFVTIPLLILCYNACCLDLWWQSRPTYCCIKPASFANLTYAHLEG